MIQTDSTATASTSAAQGLDMLRGMAFDDLVSKIAHDIISFFISLAVAILVFYAGKFIIKKLYNLVGSMMIRRNVDQSLGTFILSLLQIVLYFILLVTVIGILGINTSSFIALFASAGVAIGMALSGTLQNFAGGVLILLLKPFKVGDFIEAQGFSGTVTEIQIFSTIISTPDNKSIIIPNGGLSTGSINNWSREDYRRLDWTVSLSYGDDVDKAKEAIMEILLSVPEIVKNDIPTHRREMAGDTEQETSKDTKDDKKKYGNHIDALRSANRGSGPSVNLSALADSSINFTVRAWVPAANYWPVFYAVNERLYNELPKKGLSFPFPQMDVHITKE